MTTIVYKDGILASDRQMAQNDIVHPCDSKLLVAKAKNGDSIAAIGFAGHAVLGQAFVKWIEDGRPEKFPATHDGKSYFYALMITPVFAADGHRTIPHKVEYWDMELFPLDETGHPYSAQGAGALIAMGALYAGATAIGAVRAANYHSPDSGFGISYIDLNNEEGLEIKRATEKDK